MRITNKIIQNNSLTNINNNKILQDNLSTQLATEKKISRPSEDPIIALRALRLRTSINVTDQYRSKNAEDAKSWLTVTEDAIKTLSDVITDIRKQYVKGSSDTLTSSDRRIILENIQALGEEIYNTGNVDFAGRSVFTGFRTETSLTYKEDENTKFTITEDFTSKDMDKISYVHESDVEQNVFKEEISRIRLAYNDCDTVAPIVRVNGAEISIKSVGLDASGIGYADPYEYSMTLPDGATPPTQAVYIPETGEILFSKSFATTIEENEYNVEVAYSKTKWAKGDLRPIHYFKCESAGVQYNTTEPAEGEIEYNIGTNQTLRINTNASECFSHAICRDVDDCISCINEVDTIEKKLAELDKNYKAATTDAEREAIEEKIEAAKKEQTFLSDKLNKLFSSCITKADKYLDANNLALTNCGTRSKRLELISNRLDTELSTLKELKSENEDVDMAETAVKLTSAEYAYDAALMATGKIMKDSLLNYI